MVTILGWKMEHITLGTPSEKVLTPHYCGVASPVNIALDGYKAASSSMIKYTPSFAFRNPPGIGLRTWEQSGDCSIDLTKHGPWVIYASAGNNTWCLKSDYEEHGLMHSWDDSRHKDWIGATTGPHAIEYVKQPAFTQFTSARHERRSTHEPAKYVTEVHYHGKINDFGQTSSIAENLRQARNRHEQSREAIKDGEDIMHIGVTSNDKTIYSVGRLKNGEIRLSSGTKAGEHLSREANIFGLTLEDIIMVKQAEEAMHIKRKSYDKMLLTIGQLVREEKATKQEVLKHYKRLAEGETDPKQKEKYERAIRAIEHDIETIDRYRHARDNENVDEEALEEATEGKSKLEETVENERIDKDEAEAAEKNKEYSEREMNSEDAQEQVEVEAADEAAAEES